jgi:hypothetical protein
MYAHQHLAVSVGAATGISLVATGSVDPAFLVGAAVGAELIDLVDHPAYQLITWRRDPAVRVALRTARARGLRAGWEELRDLEDSRSIDGLYLHNAFGLAGALVLALAVAIFSDSPFWVAVVTATVGHMLCDILWDFRYVGHARNWFARSWMPWVKAPGQPRLGIYSLSVVLLLAALMWWLIERCWSVLHDAEMASSAAFVHRALAIVLLAYLTGLVFLVHVHVRWILDHTGRRTPLSRMSRDTRASELVKSLRPQAGDVMTVASLVGIAISAILVCGYQLSPSSVQDGGQPAWLALGVPLLGSAVTMMLRHTTAAGVGTLAGVLLADLLNTVIATTGGDSWDSKTSVGILLSGLVGWLSGLVVTRVTGRIGGSAIVMTFSELPDVDQTRQLVDRGYARFAQSVQVGSFGRTRTTVVQSPRSVWAAETGPSDRCASIVNPLTLRFSGVYSPLVHESAAVLNSSFDQTAGRSPLLPRSQSAPDLAHATATASIVAWQQGCPPEGRDISWPPPRRIVRRKADLTKPVSEIVDNFLTLRADFRTDVLWIDESSGCLVVREVTSTKHYTTPEAEHLAVLIQEELAMRGVLPTLVCRVVGAASLHDEAPCPDDVAPGRPLTLPDAVVKELQPSSILEVFTKTVGALLVVAGLAPLVAEAIRRF